MKNKALLAFALALVVGAASAFAANTLVVNSPGLNGTNFKMQVNVGANPDANAVYVQSDHPNAETHMLIRVRMQLDLLNAPNSGAGRNFRFMNMVDTDFPALPHKVFFLQKQQTGNWRIAVWTWNTPTGAYAFAGGHFVATGGSTADIQEECDWTMSTGTNGALTCTRVGGQSFTVSNLADTSRQTDSVQLGFFDFDGFGVSAGAMKFDEYESYR